MAIINSVHKGNCPVLLINYCCSRKANIYTTLQTFTNELTSSARTCGGDELTQSSEYVPLCICKGLSLFVCDGLGQFFLKQHSKNE